MDHVDQAQCGHLIFYTLILTWFQTVDFQVYLKKAYVEKID